MIDKFYTRVEYPYNNNVEEVLLKRTMFEEIDTSLSWKSHYGIRPKAILLLCSWYVSKISIYSNIFFVGKIKGKVPIEKKITTVT
jgi:hypothetical protein